MLERLIVRNFKRFEEIEVELGAVTLLVGPNNSGKTSALQALALWELGLRRWNEKRGPDTKAKQRAGVAINRRDLVSIPVPESNLLWRDLHVRDVKVNGGKPRTANVRIEVEVRGVTEGEAWACGLEFDFANAESIYCRPRGWSAGNGSRRPLPAPAGSVRVAHLQPMSGLAASEVLLPDGAVQVRLGEGRTADVLRNLCYSISEKSRAFVDDGAWSDLVRRLEELFGVHLERPVYVQERGELTMSYREREGPLLDLSVAGRGLQQTLLLLAHFYANPGTVLLLDEPDAHLEILRQRQIYQTLADLARSRGTQLVVASHSEVLLNEAADRDLVIAFVGQPHRIDDRGTQTAKALKSIGFEAYYQAETTGWVLYLEGATDLAMLRAFAITLGHPAAALLERPFVCYVENQVRKAEEHFFGLREAKPDLAGVVLLDRAERPPQERGGLRVLSWRRREIESYVAFPETLEAWAREFASSQSPEWRGPLFEAPLVADYIDLMRTLVADRVPPAALRDRQDRWWRDTKSSDDFLDPVFAEFFARRRLPNLMRKSGYHTLAPLVPAAGLDPDVAEKLDVLIEVAQRARPRR